MLRRARTVETPRTRTRPRTRRAYQGVNGAAFRDGRVHQGHLHVAATPGTLRPATVMAKAIIPTPYLTDIKDERKAKLELVINAAARWGFLQARAGTDEFPNS